MQQIIGKELIKSNEYGLFFITVEVEQISVSFVRFSLDIVRSSFLRFPFSKTHPIMFVRLENVKIFSKT